MGWRDQNLLVVVEASTVTKAVGTLKPRIEKAIANLAQVEHPAERFFYCYTESCAAWARSVAARIYPRKRVAIIALASEQNISPPKPC